MEDEAELPCNRLEDEECKVKVEERLDGEWERATPTSGEADLRLTCDEEEVWRRADVVVAFCG